MLQICSGSTNIHTQDYKSMAKFINNGKYSVTFSCDYLLFFIFDMPTHFWLRIFDGWRIIFCRKIVGNAVINSHHFT